MIDNENQIVERTLSMDTEQVPYQIHINFASGKDWPISYILYYIYFRSSILDLRSLISDLRSQILDLRSYDERMFIARDITIYVLCLMGESGTAVPGTC